MSDNRDALLQNLFAEADKDLDGSHFTGQVIKRTYGLVVRLGIMALTLALMLFAGLLITGVSPLAAVQQVSDILSASLIDAGDGWTAWALTPINNIASAAILSAKFVRMLYKKIVRASYVS